MFEILLNNKKILAVHIVALIVIFGVIAIVILPSFQQKKFISNNVATQLEKNDESKVENNFIKQDWKLIYGTEVPFDSTSAETISRGYTGEAKIRIWKIAYDKNKTGCRDHFISCYYLYIDKDDLSKLPSSVARDYSRSSLDLVFDYLWPLSWRDDLDDLYYGQAILDNAIHIGGRMPTIQKPIEIIIKSVRIFNNRIYLSTADVISHDHGWTLISGNPMDICDDDNYASVIYDGRTSTLHGVLTMDKNTEGFENVYGDILSYDTKSKFSFSDFPSSVTQRFNIYYNNDNAVDIMLEFDSGTKTMLNNMNFKSGEVQVEFSKIEYNCETGLSIKVDKIELNKDKFIKYL